GRGFLLGRLTALIFWLAAIEAHYRRVLLRGTGRKLPRFRERQAGKRSAQELAAPVAPALSSGTLKPSTGATQLRRKPTSPAAPSLRYPSSELCWRLWPSYRRRPRKGWSR